MLQPELLVPEGVEVLKLKAELDIRLNWRRTASKEGRKFLLVFTTIWNLFLLPFVFISFVSGNLSILLFLSLHLAVGVGLLWYMAASMLNSSSLTVTPRRFKVRSYPVPIPVFKSRDLDTGEIQQLYVSRYTNSKTNGVPNYAYALYAVKTDGTKLQLLRGMNRETQRYVEKEIENFLGIKNRPVKEEAD